MEQHATVDPIWILPFTLLLAAIAAMPFINNRWWGRNYRIVAVSLAAISASYYVFGLGQPGRIGAALHEYLGFLALVGSLFVVAGGIHIKIRGRSTPAENLVILGVGAVLSNLLGTTGASMVLIRPYLRHNKYRLAPFHVVFFIFVVSNIGGGLTPIGDPPLFLGFLKGIPFFWIGERMLLPWLVALGLVLAVFYVLDLRSFRNVSEPLRKQIIAEHDRTEITGLTNLLFLAMIVGSVFVDRPPLLREGLMLLAAAGSYFLTSREIHRRNHFSFHAIEEVAWLFLGIFVTMLPALDWLSANARQLGIESPGGFYWATGVLSGVLDNAPTYLNFLAAAMGLAGKSLDQTGDVASFLTTGASHVVAISAGAVFFGAMTYIGNGPNFMVASIARQHEAKVPSFFGYVYRYSFPVLIPVFIIVWLLFFS